MTVSRKKFDSILRNEGLFSAMRWLNAQVPYRYSAVFGFEGDLLRSICLIDKQDPNISNCPAQPITQSYCMYIQSSGEKLSIEEAALDPRVEDHPKRRNVQSYYGIPLYNANGNMLGTVCHFDTLPVPVTADIASALDDLGPSIAEAAFNLKEKYS